MKQIEHRRDGRGTVSFRRDASHALDEIDPVWGTGPGKGSIPIALVGDMPSEDDHREGLPFSGSIGKFLTWGLSEASIYRPKMWLTNVFSRRGPDGDIEHPNVQDAIESEFVDFQREIRYLVEERETKVLLLAGGAAVEAFNLAGSISHLRGSVYVWNTRTWTEAERQTDKTVLLVPTYHPGYLMRHRWTKSGKGRADFTAVWLDDLSKARRISVDGWNPPRERFNVEPTLADVTRYVEDRIQDQRLIAVDIETTGFDPKDAGIVCIGLAHSKEDALVVPLIDGPGSYYWSPGQGQEVKRLLSRLFSEGGGLVLQNALFDVPFLREKGFLIPSGAVKHDTLLLHHAVSPELPHKLGFIVSQYGDTPYWKDEFQNRDTTIVRMDQRTLRTYNARDCVVLLQVLPGLLEDLEEVGSSDVYYNESIALVEPILEMMSTGVEFDTRGQTATRQKIQRELNDVETQLRTIGGLPETFNIGSDDDLRLFLFGTVSKKYLRGEDYFKKKPGTKVRKQLEELYSVRHDTKPLYLPRGFKGRRTDGGQVTVNKQGRLSYQRHLQNRLSEIESFKKIHPKHAEEKTAIEDTLSWLALYQKWSELSKILSTYLDYPVAEDGRVHTRFLIHGTATGRLSSQKPNLQNQPKSKSSEIRRLFVAAPGHSILAADYSNLEVKVMAYETRDPILIDIVDGGKNMHDVNTRTLFHLEPSDDMWGPARRAAKIFMFGSLAYGGGDNEIYEKVILDVPELKLTFREFVEAKKRYMDSHPEYVTWKENLTSRVQKMRQVSNAFGRVRTFYGNSRDIVKEALNFPIQSAAASIINRATIRIHARLRQGNYLTRLQAQIHDELRFEVPDDELADVAAIVKEEMERPVDFHGIERRFQVEMEVGPNWSDLKEYPL